MGNTTNGRPNSRGDTPELRSLFNNHPLHHRSEGGTVPLGRPAPKPLPPYPWHDDVKPLLWQRYQVLGWSRTTWDNDWSLLRRTCGAQHPAQISTAEMEAVIVRIATQGGRVAAINRFRSIWRNLRLLGIVPEQHAPEAALPKLRKPRAVPRPISKDDALLLMTQARTPELRDWFTLACLNGLRAIEISRLQGSWLENTSEGHALRVFGKGNTDLTIPAHPEVARIIQSHRTLGRLWPVTPGYISDAACVEMRRLGVNGTFHACRHFFATYLLEASGGDLVLVAELLRHSNLNTTRGYAALRQGRKQEVLNQLFATPRVVVA